MKYKILFSTSLLFILLQPTFAQVIQPTQPSKEKWNLVTMEGTVTKINKKKREITLMGPKGNLNTIEASNEIERFEEIAVNDKISLDYWSYIKAEFREPTLFERAEPLAILSKAGSTSQDVPPGAVIGAVVKAIVTIEVLNRPFMSATVKGPAGNYTTIPVENPKILESVYIGQEFILTYAEAIAVTLKKVEIK